MYPIKSIIAIILLLTTPSFCDSVSKVRNESVVVFLYHRFGESEYPSTNIKLEQFEFHLDYLEKNNYNVWPLSKVVKYIKQKNNFLQKQFH